jgi:hypothetical protein
MKLKGRPIRNIQFTVATAPGGMNSDNIMAGEAIQGQTVLVWKTSAQGDRRGILVGTTVANPTTGAFSVILTGIAAEPSEFSCNLEGGSYLSPPVQATIPYAK